MNFRLIDCRKAKIEEDRIDKHIRTLNYEFSICVFLCLILRLLSSKKEHFLLATKLFKFINEITVNKVVDYISYTLETDYGTGRLISRALAKLKIHFWRSDLISVCSTDSPLVLITFFFLSAYVSRDFYHFAKISGMIKTTAAVK